MRYRDQVVLITGASSGIGAAMAREFAREGAHVVLCARRMDLLAGLAREIASATGRRAVPLTCDVTRDGELERVVEQALKELGRIDVVVANAGYAVSDRLENLTIEHYRKQIETNVFGVLRTIYATLEPLKKSRGRIVLIGSIAGQISLPNSTAYSMSKHAIAGLADGLGTELAFHGISVTHVMPGFIGTEIFQVDNDGKHQEKADFLPPAILTMKPSKAAQQIVRAAHCRKRTRVITSHGRIAIRAQRFFPRLVRYVLRWAP